MADSAPISLSSEAIARRISEAGGGLAPVSRIRQAIYEQALKEIRALRGHDDFYGTGTRTDGAE